MCVITNLLALLLALARTALTSTISFTVSPTAESLEVGQPQEGFVSYSIEFSSFPDFAGNKSHPNEFSNNLLDNIGNLTGTKPYIRVGGNTQDFAIYNPNLTVALNGTYNLTRSADYPTTIEIGPSFFESYTTWPDVKFSHGFNLGGNNDSRRWDTLLQTVPLACKALGKERLYAWEYGNEPDLYSTNALAPVRSLEWNESDYVAEWLNGTRTIKAILQEHCPEMAGNDTYGYIAPSFAGTDSHLKAPVAWADGLDGDGDIKYFSSHNYISSADALGVTLQGTLMNHTRTMESIEVHLAEYASIVPTPKPPHIFGEQNSLSHQGLPGTSDTFGAALWALDFGLYAAARGVARAHTHMGTGYRYASWQPVAPSTRPPYYANVATAAFLRGRSRVSALAHASGSDVDAAYAAYAGDGGALARVAVLNLRAYNYSTSNSDGTTMGGTGGRERRERRNRPTRTYALDVPGLRDGATALVRRLLANGSDAVAGVTWDGVSYAYELAAGRAVRMANVTAGETVEVRGGVVEVGVPDASAAVLDFAACR
ncbi:glycoside hydrolase family 79 protein [Biscogniauxia mediterranea]|nr:glycoside hydrolase family 79 protein [Biscogniauxia mediterranea]